MLFVCSTLVLAIHLLAVDLAMAAPLACVWLAWRESRRGDALAGVLRTRLAVLALGAMTLGIVLGTVQLGVLWLADDQEFWRATHGLTARRLWFALAELVFYYACMAGCLVLTRGKRRTWLANLLAIMAASNLMYHFPPLFSVLNLLATRPQLADVELNVAVYRSLVFDPEVLAMVVHVWLAAVAVTAVAVMRSGLAAVQRVETPPAAEAHATGRVLTSGQDLVSSAARWSLAATLCQLPVGIWVLFTLPESGRGAVTGADLLSTLLFAGGVLGALGLMHHLAAVALGDVDPTHVRRCVQFTVLVVLLMTAALERTHWIARGRLSAQLERPAFVARHDPRPARPLIHSTIEVRRFADAH